MPERFDPESKYYLTPSGNKRKATSFGPFLGGRRVCLGKTLAENVGKCMIPLIIACMDFEFVRKEFYEKKPPNDLGVDPCF